jgi:hypothetical protein
MGLDMYLNAERYLWSSSDGPNSKIKAAIQEMMPETAGMEVQTVSVEALYWRKANAIHKWFVDTLQDGVDECQTTRVNWDSLVELRALCQRVLDDNSIAPDVLPAGSGFFFGNTEYNDWYFKDLERTVEGINRIEKQLVTEETEDGERYSQWDFFYSSSW